MRTLDQPTREKIERRANRAWRKFDRGSRVTTTRVSEVKADTLLYRLSSGRQDYSGPKVTITRDDIGAITVPDSLPADPLLDLKTKSDVSGKLSNQCGPVRAYKVTKADGTGTNYSGVTYKVGETVKEPKAVTDKSAACAAGINLADLEWVKREWQSGRRIFAVEFEAPDNLAAVPTNTDGKFRVFECKVVEELDLVALGLETKPKPAEKKAAATTTKKVAATKAAKPAEKDDEEKPGFLGRLGKMLAGKKAKAKKAKPKK